MKLLCTRVLALLLLMPLDIHSQTQLPKRRPKKDLFWDRCEEMFFDTNIQANVVKEMVKSLKSYLKANCVNGQKLQFYSTFLIGSLYCDGNVPDTIEQLLNLIQQPDDRPCKEIDGFHEVYLKSYLY
ncbi:uncharacterized protein LOC108602708 [Drosophila busckii]|uniref:uncharacterized protein LOC108602708 n=1 Tax=Drosophila busckii TaxID=30019 RepID=UPI00083F3BAB|nr:uncharacterized protein LOC108602708 [Drosophila busckii]